jgi:hypothetical protein
MEFKLTCPAGPVRHGSDSRRADREACFEFRLVAETKLNFEHDAAWVPYSLSDQISISKVISGIEVVSCCSSKS